MKFRHQKIKTPVFFIALWLLIAVFAAYGQTAPATVKSETERQAAFVRRYDLSSRLMGRDLPYHLILPDAYDDAANKAKRYPVVYLLHGLTGHYDDWATRTKLAEFSRKYPYIIVMPEGNNGWYTDSASAVNEKYESYVVRELIPEIDAKFRTLNNRESRAVAGLSMGGYGALKFGLKFPEKFVVVGSFSGALGAASWTEKTIGNSWKVLIDSITRVYGAEDSPTRKDNDIYRLVREMPAEKAKALPFFYIDCGTEDFLIGQNRDFTALLMEKKIPHEFRQLPGKHDWVYWDAQLREFLRVSQKFIK